MDQTQKKINYIVLSTAPTLTDMLFLHQLTGKMGNSLHPCLLLLPL